MSERKRRQSNSSRTIAIAAVALLIVIAIAGIVLAGRSGQETADAAPAAVPAPATTPQAASAPTAANPNEVVFAAGSDKLPATAAASLARFAEAARGNANGVRLSARFLTGEHKARDLDLAKARTGAIHKVLAADGVAAEKMQVELVEMPAGSLSAADADRVDLTLR